MEGQGQGTAMGTPLHVTMVLGFESIMTRLCIVTAQLRTLGTLV